MPIKSQYEQRIRAYIDSNPASKMNRVQRIEVEGQVQDLPVYRLPIKFLVFNVENGRFASDLNTLETELGKKLNARNPVDAAKIRETLLNKSPHDTKVLREDLKRRGQVEPGVITAAGVVINANRRMATLTELYEETSNDKFAFLEAVMLPRNINDAEVYKIEARLQYAKDFRVGFGAVNELLKIREGLEKGMTEKELAALLVRDEKYIKEHLAQLKFLQAYSKYAWKKIDFKKIEQAQITEIITEVEKNQRKFKSEGLSASEINKLLEVQFAYINTGCTYRDIRTFGKYALSGGAGKSYIQALSEFKRGGTTPESFKERIDDVNVRGKIKKDENRPVELADSVLEQVKEFQDRQFKITAEIKKSFAEVSKIIIKLLNKK